MSRESVPIVLGCRRKLTCVPICLGWLPELRMIVTWLSEEFQDNTFNSFTVCSRTVNRQKVLPCCKANFLLLKFSCSADSSWKRPVVWWSDVSPRVTGVRSSVRCCSSLTCQVWRPWWVLTGRRRADELSRTSSHWWVLVITGLILSRSLPFLTSATDLCCCVCCCCVCCCCVCCCVSVCYFICHRFLSFQLALLYIAITYWDILCKYYCVLSVCL